MYHKNLETHIGKDSICVSSDYNAPYSPPSSSLLLVLPSSNATRNHQHEIVIDDNVNPISTQPKLSTTKLSSNSVFSPLKHYHKRFSATKDIIIHLLQRLRRLQTHIRNGDAYAGEYFSDKMHGFGVYSFANGHKYEGSWHEGKRQGFGVYTFRNGDTRSGHWQNGVLDISPPVPEYRSKVLNAIQEARGAAEKAYDATAKMDEKVNIVVIFANRAANAARVAAIKAVQRQMHQRRNSDELPIPVLQNIHHLPNQLTA